MLLVFSPNGEYVAPTGLTLAIAASSTAYAGRSIVFTSDETLSDNLNWPADREFMPLSGSGAKINHGAYTISYAGSTARWPVAQIFNGAGAVTIAGDAPYAFPQWFGAAVDDATDDATAYGKAAACGPPVYLTDNIRVGGLAGTHQILGAGLLKTSTGSLYANAVNSFMAGLSGDQGRKYRLISGVIRNSGSGWALIDDAGHRPQGISGVSAQGDAIRLTYNFTGAKVASLLVVPDETFAAMGVMVGASVAANLSDIYVSVPFRAGINLDSLAYVNTPTYVSSKLTLAKNGNVLDITHPASDYPPTVTVLGSASTANLTAGVSSTKINVGNAVPLAGFIEYNAGTSQWVLNSDLSDESGISFVFAADKLTVTHPTIADDVVLSLTPRGPYTVRAGGVGATTFEVQFYSAAGSLVTTPDANCRVYFNRGGRFLSENYPLGYVTIDRGFIQVNANSIISATGNFWIFGLMEM